MPERAPGSSVAEQLAARIGGVVPGRLPETVRRKCEDLVIDVIGLCVTARNQDYVASARSAFDDDGPCTAIGHARTVGPAGEGGRGRHQDNAPVPGCPSGRGLTESSPFCARSVTWAA